MIRLFKFIATSILFSLTLLAPVHSAENVKFKSSSTYSGKKIELRGELNLSRNKSKQPVVILLHGCSGLEQVVKSGLRNHASALNNNGFATLILDSFGPRKNGNGWVCDKTSRLTSAQAYRGRDVNDAIKYLKTRQEIDPENIFIMGQSNGGSVVSIISKRPKGVRAAVAYYPWCSAVPSQPKIPLLVLSGSKDDWTPPTDCKRRDKPGGNLSVIIYQNAVHSFDLNIPVTSYKGFKVGANAQARNKSRAKMISFFKEHLKK